MCSSLFDELDREWRTVVNGAEADRALARWAVDSALGGTVSLDDVLARTGPGTEAVAANSVLLALVQRAATDDVAARTALQALLPGLRRVAQRLRSTSDPQDLAAEVIGAAWARICTYPSGRRSERVAANVILDVFHALWQQRVDARWEHVRDPVDFTSLIEPADGGMTGLTARDVLEAVAATGEVPPAQLRVVADAVLDRRTAADAARRLGISAKAMERRRERARARVISTYRRVGVFPAVAGSLGSGLDVESEALSA